MRWAANILAAGLALAMSGHPAMASDANSPNDAQAKTVTAPAPHGREVLDEGVTQVAVQATFHPTDDQQKLLSLLLLLSTPPERGRSK